jgi:LPXTG-site transpeptidase (sortase) family protein
VETIEIHGGTIDATGAEGAAGIGAGFYGAGGSISISGGNITATTANNGSGIGGGMMNGNCGNINISGGTIEATGVGTGAGIGCGGGAAASSGVITITGMPRLLAIGSNTDVSATLVNIGGSGFILMKRSTMPNNVNTSTHEFDNTLDKDSGASTINGYSVPSSWLGGNTNSGYFTATGGPRQVTFVENGGTAVDDLSVIDGSKLTPPDSTKAGYDLADWYLDSEFNTLWNFGTDTVDSDITLYAKWLKADLSSTLLIDNDSSGELVGTVGTSSGGLTLTLSDSGTYLDNQYFSVNGNRLVFSGTADIINKSTYTIKITITTAGGVSKSIVYTITVKRDGSTNGGSANPDSYSVAKNSSIESNPMENDEFSTSGGTWSGHWIIRQPSHGSAEIGSIIYTPDEGYSGSDSLTYMACDNANYCMRGSVSYTVGSGSGSGSGSSSAGNVLPYTGFPIGSVTELAVQPADASYLEMEMQLEIPALDVSVAIIGVPSTESGWDVTWLGDKAGYLEGSAFPTWEGNTVLTAHNYKSNGLPGPFNKLEMLNYGDLVTIHAWEQDYIYEVRTRDIVNPDDTRWLSTSGYDMVTLITCKNYDESSGSYLNRVVVQAVLVDIVAIE